MSIFLCCFVLLVGQNDVDKEITAMWMLLTEMCFLKENEFGIDMVIMVRSEGQTMRFMGMRIFVF